MFFFKYGRQRLTGTWWLSQSFAGVIPPATLKKETLMTTAERIKNAKFAEAKKIVREKLLTDNEWLVRGLICLFHRQTEDEKAIEGTKHRNTRGFNSADSNLLTGFAKQWLARNWFSDNQMPILRRKMLKYAGQLARIVRGEEEIAADE
jgi:hypothetical protein